MTRVYASDEVDISTLWAILGNIPAGVFVSDARDRIILVNETAAQLLSDWFDTLVGLNVHDVLETLDKASFGGLRTELSLDQRVTIRSPGGDYRVIRIRTAPLSLDEQGFVGRVFVLHEVTKEFEPLEFLHVAVSELRMPLSAIIGYVDLILEGDAGDVNETVREFLTVVQEYGRRLSEVINGTLEASHIVSGHTRLNLEPVNVRVVLDEELDTVRTQIAERQLTLRVNLPPDLLVRADAPEFHQVLFILLDNACKYTLPGGTITVTAQVRGQVVQVNVADTGIGISKEDQQRLFTRWHRADSVLVRKVRGSGLGLFIAKSLVNLLGGEIWATSEPDIGSTFSFTLPLAEPEEQV